MFAVFIDQVSPRIHYVFEELILRRLGVTLNIHQNIEDFISDPAPYKFQYSQSEIGQPEILKLKPNALLFSDEIDPFFDPEIGHFYLNDAAKEVLFQKIEDLTLPHSEKDRMKQVCLEPFPCLFPDDSELGFDVFAMSFYFLSRYEEYQKFEADSYGRFQYKNSLISQWDYNPAPFVDIAFYYFLAHIKALHLIPKMDIIPTFDIDIAFRFKGRSFRRQLASTLKYPKPIFDRIRVWLGSKDPFDPEHTVFHFIRKHEIEKAFVFWLCSNRVRGVNRQIKRNYPLFGKRINESKKIATVGIHPSMTQRPELLWEEEKLWLEKTLMTSVVHSRQHFVHLLFPETYRNLLKMGVTDDWSMGFAEAAGFRAGTSYSFLWFDLIHNQTTSLRIHPFCIMDVTAKNYLNLTPFGAVDMGRSLKELVFLFGGSFTFIAHNESLSETEGWEDWLHVFESWSRKHIIVSKSLGY
jgi:hypothetical protein